MRAGNILGVSNTIYIYQESTPTGVYIFVSYNLYLTIIFLIIAGTC